MRNPPQEMTDSFRVELRNVTKRFGETIAVDDLTLLIRDGEFFSLIGPSGCGKTTTLRCVAGLEEPDAGRIEIAGQVVYDSAAGVSVPTHQRPGESSVPLVSLL